MQAGQGGRRRSAPILSFRKKLAFTAVVTVAFLLVAEGAARIWLFCLAKPTAYPKVALYSEFPTAARFTRHPYLPYVLTPNYCRGAVSHNSLGFRGPEVSPTKPEGTYRILFLGGSTTYCEYIDHNDDTLTARLEARLAPNQLAAQVPAKGHDRRWIEVINCGVPGYNSWESFIQLSLIGMDLEPDLVVIQHGVNDVHARFVQPEHYTSDNRGKRRPWSDPVEVQLLRYSLLTRLVGASLGLWHHPGIDNFVESPWSDPGRKGMRTHAGSDPMETLDRNPPRYLERNIRQTIAVAQSAGPSGSHSSGGAKVLILATCWSPECGDYVTLPHYKRALEEHNAILRRLAEAEGVCFLDLSQRMPTHRDYWRDGRHFSAAGADWQAARIAEWMVAQGLLRDDPNPTHESEKSGDSRQPARPTPWEAARPRNPIR